MDGGDALLQPQAIGVVDLLAAVGGLYLDADDVGDAAAFAHQSQRHWREQYPHRFRDR